MQRSDVVLADLVSFVDDNGNHHNSTRIVLAVASDTSSLLPCCGQSLGFRNAQISKLWSPAHWKNEDCRTYWKDTHLICVRKHRPNSTYATVNEVRVVLGDDFPFLHELPAAAPSIRKVSSKPVLGARTPSSAASNATKKVTTLRSVSSLSKLHGSSTTSQADRRSPSQATQRATAKPRASEPLVPARMPTVRSPIMTRRRSNTALHMQRPSISPQPPLPHASSAYRQSPSARPPLRRASVDAVASNTSRRISSGAPRSVSGSGIPTPVRRLSANLLDTIRQGSPSSPSEHSKAMRASLRHRRSPTSISIAVQTDPEENPLLDDLVNLSGQYERLQRDHEAALTYVRELEAENKRLRKQKGGIAQETDKLKEQKRTLEGTISELTKTNANLLDENGWIVICKTEQEEQLKKLEMENESLAAQYAIMSNQRKELELNDALEQISRLQVAAAVATLNDQPIYQSTPMKTPVTRFKEALDPVTVYKTPYLTPVKNLTDDTAGYDEAPSTPVQSRTPVKRTPPGSMSARKARTPLVASAKRQKSGLRFWKRVAKHRMFG